jgi:hypothetical protein
VAVPAKRDTTRQPSQLPPPPPLIPPDFTLPPDRPAHEVLGDTYVYKEPTLQNLQAYAFQGVPLPEFKNNAPPPLHKPEQPMPRICPLSMMTPEERADCERKRGILEAHRLSLFSISHHKRPTGPSREQQAQKAADAEHFSLRQSDFEYLQQRSGKTFTWDACCDGQGVNAHCKNFSSPDKSFLACDVSGQHVWLFPHASIAEQCVSHLIDCWRKSPKTTSGVVLLHASMSHLANAEDCHLRLLHKYGRRERIFQAPSIADTDPPIMRAQYPMHAYALDQVP